MDAFPTFCVEGVPKSVRFWLFCTDLVEKVIKTRTPEAEWQGLVYLGRIYQCD